MPVWRCGACGAVQRSGKERLSVSVGDAAALVSVSRRTIYLWLAAGKLTTQRTAGGSLRIETESLWQTKEEKHEKKPSSSR